MHTEAIISKSYFAKIACVRIEPYFDLCKEYIANLVLYKNNKNKAHASH